MKDFIICAAIMGAVSGLLGYWVGDRGGSERVQAAWDRDKLARSEEERKAEEERAKTANNVQRTYDAEINKLRVALGRSERLRVGTAICGTAESTPDSAGSDSASTGSRVLSEEMDRDIKSLILETEQVAATARACQVVLLPKG